MAAAAAEPAEPAEPCPTTSSSNRNNHAAAAASLSTRSSAPSSQPQHGQHAAPHLQLLRLQARPPQAGPEAAPGVHHSSGGPPGHADPVLPSQGLYPEAPAAVAAAVTAGCVGVRGRPAVWASSRAGMRAWDAWRPGRLRRACLEPASAQASQSACLALYLLASHHPQHHITAGTTSPAACVTTPHSLCCRGTI